MRCHPGEGLGNSFLLVEAEEVERSSTPPGELARQWCAPMVDGLLVLGRPCSGERPVQVFNRDGSEGELCLNGLRVVALWEGGEEGAFRMAGRRVRWQVVGRERELPAGTAAAGQVELWLPEDSLPEEVRFQRVPLHGERAGLAVHFWNPHCVVLTDSLQGVDLESLAVAAARHQEIFPDGLNLELVAPGRHVGQLHMRVWERGVGETRACGSGAVAVALAVWAGSEGAIQPLEVQMPGGSLVISPDRERGGIRVLGPATLGQAVELRLA